MRNCAFGQRKLQAAGYNGKHGQNGMGRDRLRCRQEWFNIHVWYVPQARNAFHAKLKLELNWEV